VIFEKGDKMSEERNVNQDPSLDASKNTGELSEDQLGDVQGGNSISVPVQLARASAPKIQNKTTGGSIAQGDTLDNTLTEDGLPS
jgi:hypothetical protein